MNRQAAGITAQTMYGARMAWPDLLRCVANLSTYLTCWSHREDKKLLKMTQYINSSADLKQVGFIGES